jgi:hypothetical protein
VAGWIDHGRRRIGKSEKAREERKEEGRRKTDDRTGIGGRTSTLLVPNCKYKGASDIGITLVDVARTRV